MNRIVTSPRGVTLSDGTYLPHHTVVGFGHPFYPGSTVPSESPLRTPSQPPLDEFHPFRFSDLRAQKGEENNHQFVSSDPNNIAFGYGRNACPGRFFASNEIKVILIELLKRYDIALGPNGETLKDGFERPKMLESGAFYGPDPKGVVYFRNRKV
jgi:gliotoxin biosynthesis cytochrome P450 monooxygenase